MSPVNITVQDKKIIQDIVKKIIPGIKVEAYGSRVKEHHKKFSDLDLIVHMDLTKNLASYSNLRMASEDSELAYKIDLTPAENAQYLNHATTVELQTGSPTTKDTTS